MNFIYVIEKGGRDGQWAIRRVLHGLTEAEAKDQLRSLNRDFPDIKHRLVRYLPEEP
jgi:hypothetical protein